MKDTPDSILNGRSASKALELIEGFSPARTAGYSDFYPDIVEMQRMLITVIGEGRAVADTDTANPGDCIMRDVKITENNIGFTLLVVNPIKGLIHTENISIRLPSGSDLCSLLYSSSEFVVAIDLIKPRKNVSLSEVFVAPHCIIFSPEKAVSPLHIKVNTRSPIVSTLSDNNLFIELKTDDDNYIFTDKKAEGLISINGEKSDAGNFSIMGVGDTLVIVSKPTVSSKQS